jgi:formylglycine-generating enzyme required for sulfatase activity
MIPDIKPAAFFNTPPLPDLDLCPVNGGEYLMGDDNTNPAHPVRVSGFYMGKFPVTQQLWQAVMGSNGSNPSKFKGERPVETVSWEDAQTFVDRLNARTEVQDFIRQLDPPGTEFRLPTEAEWEFAACGGIYSQGYTYAGSEQLEQVGWYNKNSDDQTHEVGLLLANELGLHDMSGNVWEWCQDWFYYKYYEVCHKRGTVENPQGPDKGVYRVVRGGSWYDSPMHVRSAFRNWYDPALRCVNVGFRLVLPFQLTETGQGHLQ